MVESGRVKNVVVNLAVQAASHHDESDRRLLASGDRVELERWLRHFPAATPFITVRLYDAQIWLALHRAWRAKP